jgi:hypothetical protein
MRCITMLAALAVTAAIVTPAANARPIIDLPTAAACDPSAVPPPPSSIAVSAAKEYAALRACAGQDDSTIVASAPIAREPSPPTSFDWVSATIGAIAAAGLSLALAAGLGLRRRTGPQAATA